MSEQKQGEMEGDQGDAKAQPSGPKGDHPGTASQSEIKVNTGAVDSGDGKLNPSAPGETGTTPGTNAK